VEQEGKRSGEENGMTPDGEDLYFAISARAAVLARHIRVDSENPVEVLEEVNAHAQRADEKASEDQPKEEK